jgi:predicted nucleotidyltransferase
MVKNLPGDISMTQKTILSEKALKVVNSYRQDLFNAGIKVDRIIVFGSQIRGNSKPGSDIDVCVVSDTFTDDLHGEMVRLLKIRSVSSLDIEPHPMRPQDLEDRFDVLAGEIRKYGVSV